MFYEYQVNRLIESFWGRMFIYRGIDSFIHVSFVCPFKLLELRNRL